MPQTNATATLALDRLPSSRIFDHDDHLHVEQVHITKAGVSPYLGEEIPGWEQLGLEPKRVYRLLRDPAELEKAVPTLNNKPLLFGHNPVHAERHDHERTVGTVSNPKWNPPFVDSDMAVWSNRHEAIDCIKDDRQKELSSAYHYTPVMIPGTYEGEPFDGKMTKIAFNHVGLVPRGRVGSDCVVLDSAETVIEYLTAATDAARKIVAAQPATDAHGRAGPPTPNGASPGAILMAKDTMSRAAARTQDVLFGRYRGLIAQDHKLDFGPLLKGVTKANFAGRKPALVLGLQAALKGKLAQDEEAEIADVPALIEAVEETIVAEIADQSDMAPADVVDDDKTAEDAPPDMDALKAMLSAKGLDDAAVAEVCAAVEKMMPDPGEGPKPLVIAGDAALRRPTPNAGKGADTVSRADATRMAQDAAREAAKGKIDQLAMDAAIERAVTAERKRGDDLRKAFDFVEPWVGKLPGVACDSAEKVHRAALDVLKVDHKGLHPDALAPILCAQPKPGDAPRPSARHALAQDAAGKVPSYDEMFPHAGRLAN